MKPRSSFPQSGPIANGVSRRRFLSLPALAAGLSVPGVARLAEASSFWDALDPAAGAGQLALAYWLGSDKLEGLDELSHAGAGPLRDLLGEAVDVAACVAETRAPLVDARRLPVVDSGLAGREATITIHGRYSVSSGAEQPRPERMAMYVRDAAADGPAFLAWGIDGGKPGNESPPTQFRVQARGRGGIRLSCEFEGGAEAASRGLNHCDPGYFASERFVHLQFGDGWAQPKLRRGVYLLAWRGGEGAALPPWSKYQMAVGRPLPPESDSVDEEQPRLAGETAAAVEPRANEEPTSGPVYSRLVNTGSIGGAGFSYLLLSVDNSVSTTA